MDRRRFIRTTSGGLLAFGAGCISTGRSITDSRLATVEVAEVGSLPDDCPISAGITMLDPEITNDHTATVKVTLTNETERAWEVVAGEGWQGILSTRMSDQLNPGLVLISKEYKEYVRKTRPDCWQLTALPSRNFVMVGSHVRPDESVSTELLVWGHPQNESCYPTGDYAFSERYTVSVPKWQTTESGRSDEGTDRKHVFDWRFALTLRGY